MSERKIITIRVSKELRDRFSDHCRRLSVERKEHVSVNSIGEQLIEEWCEDRLMATPSTEVTNG